MYALTKTMTNYLPSNRHLAGLLAVFMGSLFCLWLNASLNSWTNGRIVGLSSLTLAILLGMIVGNTIYPRVAERLHVGVTFAKGQILRLAIMFYGFKLTLTQVSSVGMPAIMTDALVLTSTFSAHLLVGYKMAKGRQKNDLIDWLRR